MLRRQPDEDEGGRIRNPPHEAAAVESQVDEVYVGDEHVRRPHHPERPLRDVLVVRFGVRGPVGAGARVRRRPPPTSSSVAAEAPAGVTMMVVTVVAAVVAARMVPHFAPQAQRDGRRGIERHGERLMGGRERQEPRRRRSPLFHAHSGGGSPPPGCGTRAVAPGHTRSASPSHGERLGRHTHRRPPQGKRNAAIAASNTWETGLRDALLANARFWKRRTNRLPVEFSRTIAASDATVC